MVKKLRVAGLQYKQLVVAQDPEEEEGPTEEELVDEYEKSPEANWKEYEQLIVRSLQTQYGTEVVLVGTALETSYGGPGSGFNIKGFLKFPKGRPIGVLDQFGEAPIIFRAYIADGELVDPISLSFD